MSHIDGRVAIVGVVPRTARNDLRWAAKGVNGRRWGGEEALDIRRPGAETRPTS